MTAAAAEPIGTVVDLPVKTKLVEDILELESVRFQLSGYVDQKMTRRFIEQAQAAHNEDQEAIWEVVITSEGGDMFAGTAIYSELKSYSVSDGGGHWIVTRVRGICGSVATLILQAGDVRVAGYMDSLHYHEPLLTLTDSPLTQARDMLWQCENWLHRYAAIHEERSGLKAEEFLDRLKGHEWNLSANEAKRFGFIDIVDGVTV
ncbi:protease [Mycobacterium phage Kumao]|uniref:ClpP-like protease n=1 Tax=Mycobacterium phage Kumao TaxID=2041344 RepID=A0A2D1GPP5_9CAUD|nr:protease [Mycobacterium phage Kumao]ATN94012.1 ClpP-like protease [Mycobacterium phage Kumao]